MAILACSYTIAIEEFFFFSAQAFLGYLSDRGPKNYAMSDLHSFQKYPDPPIVMNVERNIVEGQYNYPLVSPNASESLYCQNSYCICIIIVCCYVNPHACINNA